MRKWLYEKVSGDSTINGYVPAAKVYAAGAVGLPGSPDLVPPFIVIRALPTNPALLGADVQVAQMPYYVWVHDAQGSFEALIAPVLDRLRLLLPTKDPIVRPEGTIMACVWEGDSNDLFDDGFKTATRYGQYRLTVRR